MRSSVLVLVISLGACVKAEPPPKDDTPSSSEVQAVEPAVDPCIELAQLYCENTSIACEQMEQLLREAEFDIDRMDVSCPGVSQARGQMPPNGNERWCERADGRRHGPAQTWNGAGELVRTVEYVDGEAVEVSFRMPASQELAPELFMCPKGASEAKGDRSRRACVGANGLAEGPAVSWRDGKVVMIESYQGGEAVGMTGMSPAPAAR